MAKSESRKVYPLSKDLAEAKRLRKEYDKTLTKLKPIAQRLGNYPASALTDKQLADRKWIRRGLFRKSPASSSGSDT